MKGLQLKLYMIWYVRQSASARLRLTSKLVEGYLLTVNYCDDLKFKSSFPAAAGDFSAEIFNPSILRERLKSSFLNPRIENWK